MLDRRSFLAALGAALAGAPSLARAAPSGPGPLYISACMDPAERGTASVAAFDADGRLLFATRLPARGHDAAVRPESREVVVFARRPGNWAAVMDRSSGLVRKLVTSPPQRHFFGHGVFSPDGRLLYATENRLETGEGVLGVYDAEAGYARVDERPTHGTGPHDIALLPTSGLVVANGGTRTHPDRGREILNIDAMEPSLTVVDPRSGRAMAQTVFDPALRPLSIRHLAISADGEVAFGCQWMGDPEAAPPLVGLVSTSGQARFLEMPDDDLAALDHYVGSVALDATCEILAATSPRGGVIAFWERSTGRYLGLQRFADVCGVAPLGSEDRQRSGGLFVASSGHAGLRFVSPNDAQRMVVNGTDLNAFAWDNHIRPLM